MKYLLALALIATLLFSNDEFDFEDDLLQGLDEVSEIATKTKLNIDDSPSFVSILHSNKLQKLGISNVFEALGQVPGVQLKREKSGVPVVVFRGVVQKGEVKLMVDGVSINNTYRGSIYHFLNFPIELIERIEIIRGAGSVLYGSGAISGVVNIITKSATTQNINNVFISGGTYGNTKGGAIVSTNIGDTKIAIDTFYQKSDKVIDATDRHLNDFSVGLNINSEHFGFLARVKKFEIGNAYGILDVPDVEENKYFNTNGTFFTQLSYTNTLAKKSEIEILTGLNRYGQNIEAKHSRIGSIEAKFIENSYYGQIDIKSKIIKNNEFLLGTKFETALSVKSEQSIGSPVANPDSKRDTTSLYFNDKYTVYSNLDISAGLRYDKYSDFGDALSPTLSLVYRMSDTLRLKALYAQAFRAPSWIELTSNKNLIAETSDSYELGFVYKQNQNNILRLNIYSTKIYDMITKSTTYIQNTNAIFKGSEFEYLYTPFNNLEINLLASYIQAKDDKNNDIPDIANILATASLLYEHDSGVSFGTFLKYCSGQKRSDTDTRENMANSTIVDTTLSYTITDVTASLIVKDIFNEGTYYALPSSSLNNDFNDGGRSFLLKASWEF